jgi:flagellar hook-associated protein FlgK
VRRRRFLRFHGGPRGIGFRHGDARYDDLRSIQQLFGDDDSDFERTLIRHLFTAADHLESAPLSGATCHAARAALLQNS